MTTPTPEERLEQMLDGDGNHIKAKPRGVAQRFGTLRFLGGVFVLLGLAPWGCAWAVWANAPRLGLSGDVGGLAVGALVAVAVVSTVAGLAAGELIALLVSVEHQLRVIAARLKRD